MSLTSKEPEQNVFMFVITPSDKLGYEVENWTGGINEMTRINQAQLT